VKTILSKFNALANQDKALYPECIRCKIIGLALTGYKVIGAHAALSGFFVRNISMRPHFMAKLGRDIYGCAGYLLHQSVNPFQLCHHYLTVIGKAPVKVIGAHTHA